MKNRLYRRWGSVVTIIAMLFGLCGQAWAADEISRLVLSKNDLSLEIGDTYQLSATAIYVSGATENVTIKTDWQSSTPTVAGAYAGVITAKAEGTAIITATYSGKTVVVNVTVDKKVRSLTKNKTASSLRAGASDQITLMATYTDGTTANVTSKADWSTSNDGVATVSDGLITGVSSGTATVTAKYGSQVVTVAVEVDPVRRLDPDKTDLILKVGGTQQIKLMALFDNGDYEDIADKAEWSSNKENIADAFKGLITAYGTGEATITAQYGSKTASIVVSVDVAKRLDADQSDLFLRTNDSQQIKLTAVYADGTSDDVTAKATWSSDNEDVAGVDEGKVTGYSSGKATVTASYGGKSTTINVDVETPRKLEMDVTSIQLKTGNTAKIKLTATYADGTKEDVTQRASWTSDNEAVAYANKGTVTAYKAGEATITAKFGTASVQAVVDVDVARSLTLNKKSVSLRSGQSEQLTLTAILADGSKQDVTAEAEWSVDQEDVASVTNGKITTYGSGQATVTAKYGEKSAVATVVVELARKLELDATDVYLKENGSKQLKLTATFEDGTAEDVTGKADWSTDNGNVASVNKGQITGNKMGQAVVTAKYGDKTVTVTVDVATPRKLTVSKTSLDLRAGGTEQLTVTALYADGTTADVTDKAAWSVDNEDIALASKGKVTGYKSGKAVVTAAYGSRTAAVQVEVDQATTIAASKTKLNLQAGDTEQVTVTVTYPDGTTEDVTQKAEWSSKAASVADVKKGLISALDRGSATITAKYGDKTATVTVTVGEVSGLTISESKLVLQEGQSATVTLTAAFKDGKQKNVTDEAEWGTSSDKIAKVTSGTIKAYGSGKATITARYGDRSETVEVEVDMASKLSANTKLLVLEKNGQFQLVVTAMNSSLESEDVTEKAQWKTNNDKVADVTLGMVTAYGSGKATITASYGGKSVTVPVEVEVAQKLAFNKRIVYLKSGSEETLTLTATFADGTTKDVTSAAEWTSSNYTTVDVNQGTVSGVQYGKATVSAKYGGKRAFLQVTVDELKYLKASDKKLTLSVNDTKQVKLTATYKDGSEAEVNSQAAWKSTNDKVADVKDGLITVYGKGTASITAKYGGKTVSIVVIGK
ncbi:Ig-like domain-containing protein [Paenibacillus hamazuiensis]|uniref:Ig-like domain-containing protein n=1 Tax=Paenibacillus hamazuiensis TaxID=2936508 RepID=UPI00200FBE45|nr:Ig-like domain-containing protein [Paenibacillus hamazuiensis]